MHACPCGFGAERVSGQCLECVEVALADQVVHFTCHMDPSGGISVSVMTGYLQENRPFRGDFPFFQPTILDTPGLWKPPERKPYFLPKWDAPSGRFGDSGVSGCAMA